MVLADKKEKNKEKKKEESSKKKKSKYDDSEKLERGYVKTRVIIEVVGKPKSYVETTIKKYLSEIEKSINYEITHAELAKPEKVENEEMFSTYVEIDFWSKNINSLIGFCFDFMPSSVEILEPEKLVYSAVEFSGMLNDLQAKLFKVDADFKNVRKNNEIIHKNLSNMIRNNIMLSISIGNKKIKDISKITGIPTDNLTDIMDRMVHEKHITKQGDSYELQK